ncbi:GAF domain-containing protein [Rhodopseudomonas palustris]|uniref:GAF domain-containing protein n=1 Tax=Rhodopseudomonas palustris TaxID=1076 RepID=UPI000641CFD0|nr:GAF domain-containing protein [Rhodopseudomonas palustris]
MQSGLDNSAELDLADCAATRLGAGRRALGVSAASIHPHAALLALAQDDLVIVHAGGATESLVGAAAELLPGTAAATVFSSDQIARLRALALSERLIERPLHAFTLNAPDATPTDAIVHQASGLLVVELDPRREPAPDNSLALVQSMIRKLQRTSTVGQFCDAMVAELHRVTGFDRVMVYRFAADGSGDVIAEARAPDVGSLLGLRDPQPDIPKQSEPFSRIRVQPDAQAIAAPVLPGINPGSGAALDLSHSAIRSASPEHRLYLAQLGVAASLSLSLVVDGEPWGLMVCHHRTPRFLPYRMREACTLFAEMASSQLETRLSAERLAARLRSGRVHEELVTRMSQESDLAEGLIRFYPNLLDFIPAAGVGLWIDGQFTGVGVTPDAGQVAALMGWLHGVPHDGVYHTDALPLAYPPAKAIAAQACGLIALSLSDTPRDYVLWFRPEVVRRITWAGIPNKPVSVDSNGGRTASKGGAARPDSVRLHSDPWSEAEVEAARRLRESLLDVVLRRIDGIARERKSAQLLHEQLMRQVEIGLMRSKDVAQTLREEKERRVLVEADLSQVLRRTVEDQEAERLRIARELHDTLGQSLTLLQLGFDKLGQAAGDLPELQQRIAEMRSLTADLGRQTSRLAWEIRPSALDDLGLQTAIQNLLESWSEKSDVAFDLHITLGARRLPSLVETTLYRVLQEALTNVVRHAAACHVGVVLRLSGDQVTMIVEDDGRGFATAGLRQPADRLGLLGIRERLSLVGGSLELETAPGKGTTLYARVPL